MPVADYICKGWMKSGLQPSLDLDVLCDLSILKMDLAATQIQGIIQQDVIRVKRYLITGV